MLVAAALCPSAPVLVPELSQRAAPELADIRRACDEAVTDLLQHSAAELIVVAAGPMTRSFGARSTAGFHSLGVALGIPPLIGEADAGERLPVALTVGRWLLRRARHAGDVTWCTVDASGARAWGEQIAATPDPITLLVLGEGSAAIGPHAPLPQDDRSAGFDAAVTEAVTGNQSLARLDGGLAALLGATGWAPWQALAASAGGRPVVGRVRAYGAPYGVGYVVGSWDLT